MANSQPSNTIISARKFVNLQCRISSRNVSTKVSVLCETKEIEFPEGLQRVGTIASVNAGPNHRMKIPKRNNSKEDFTLQKNYVKEGYDKSHT